MDSAKNQLTDALKGATNILVTVSRDPSVDQLSACIGLTLLLNKLDKHATAVFSGKVPSTIEFLQPEDTLEKNTDSLRDFIIALDKSKADKLRYKVEDNVVRIFITPYRTSISQDDLEFSQGDFNVDVVVALGVNRQEDLDEAITSHGRILHDATVASINVSAEGGLGSINWHDQQASSLSELVSDLALALGPELLDQQMATALLTGIVAETNRFSNDKTSSETMRASAALMAAGADQQLVASKLEEPEQVPEEESVDLDDDDNEQTDHQSDDKPQDDGTIEIDHSASKEPPQETETALELPEPQPEEAAVEQPPAGPQIELTSDGSNMAIQPPTLGGTLTANSQPPGMDPATDPLSMMADSPLLNHASAEPAPQPSLKAPTIEPPEPLPPVEPANDNISASLTPPPPPAEPAQPAPLPTPPEVSTETLAELESSMHQQEDSARDEISRALSSAPAPLTPKTDLGSQPLGDPLHMPPAPVMVPPMEQPVIDADPTAVPADAFTKQIEQKDEPDTLQLNQEPTPPSLTPPAPDEPQATSQVTEANEPPPVPPPLAFNPAQFSTPTPPSNNPPQS